MKNYNLHDMVEVTVDDRVSDDLRQAIDFQIAHFLTRKPANPAAALIRVMPYADWQRHRPEEACAFHLCRGGDGRWMEDPVNRCAYVRTDAGFDVYADNSVMLINMIIQLLVVPLGFTMVHAAAVADPQGRVTLLPGPGGVGKTAVLGALVRDHDYRLLGDDVVFISDRGECLSFPRSFVLKAYHESVYPALFHRLGITAEQRRHARRGSFAKTAINAVADNIPFKGILRWTLRKTGVLQSVQQSIALPRPDPYLAAVPVEEVLGDQCVIARGPITRMVFMERYDGLTFRDEPMEHQAMTRRLVAIIHHEWVQHMRHFWTLGSLEVADLPAYFSEVHRIADNAARRVPAMRLLIPANATPAELVRAFQNVDAGSNREAA